MKQKAKKVLTVLLKTVAFILLFIISYGAIGSLISLIPVNTDFQECKKDGVEIYIKTNGFHTDFIVPVRNDIKDWSNFVDSKNTISRDTSYSYVSFGWGDKGFYKEAKKIKDIRFSTVFKAAFFLSRSAMHVEFKKGVQENENCKKICISKENYKNLVAYIETSFRVNDKNKTILSNIEPYNPNDLFYDAIGTYNLFYTCNTWTNQGLKAAGLKACLWTPFSFGIFFHY
jgi:uncharacterized protein (TIGR02117 family)